MESPNPPQSRAAGTKRSVSTARATEQSSPPEHDDSTNNAAPQPPAVTTRRTRQKTNRSTTSDAPSLEGASSAAITGAVEEKESKATPSKNHQKWQHKFALLCAFQRENGHCHVPKQLVVESVKLGSWVHMQRLYYRHFMRGKKGSNALITDERIAQLNAIGFPWKRVPEVSNRVEDAWQRKFQRLCEFRKEQGHCQVPQDYVVDSVKLGRWVWKQRNGHKQYMEGSKGKCAGMTKERIAQLNTIGFEWHPDTWPDMFQLLCAFHQKNGHCQIPNPFLVDSVNLGIWVRRQKRYYKNYMEGKRGKCALLTTERIAQLNTIGFEEEIWARRSTWTGKFQLLCAFQLENGHCQVPHSLVVDSVHLGFWVRRQRRFYKNYMEGKNDDSALITEERIARLNAVGFEWEEILEDKTKCDAWQRKFQLLCAFQKENGHCQVPRLLVVDSVNLGSWVRRQRRFYNQYMEGKTDQCDLITKERIAQLNAIGFEWKEIVETAVDEDKWQHSYQLLCAFQQENGHCRVPQNHVVGTEKLGLWVRSQRCMYKNSMERKEDETPSITITEAQITKLNAIGFEWVLKKSTQGDAWQRKFQLLCAFRQEHGHSRVPQNYVVDSVKLGTWVSSQRFKIKNGTLAKERVSQLQLIEFELKIQKSERSSKGKRQIAGDSSGEGGGDAAAAVVEQV